jgi:hypothetical protein
MRAKRDDAERQGVDGAQVGMAAPAVPDGFVADTVFLTIEGESNKRRSEDVGVGTRGVVQRPTANPKADIPEAELGVPGCAEVFTRPEQKEKAKTNQASGSGQGVWQHRQGSLAPHLGDQGERERLNT